MNAVALPRLRIVILCAGYSARLGHPKAIARVHSLSLLRRTLLLADALLPGEIIVVVPPRTGRYRIEARRIKATFATNSRREEGLSSSVRRAIAQARYSSAVLLLPVDLIALRGRELSRLISRWRASRRCVIATRIDVKNPRPRGGIPLILPRWLYPRALSVTGDAGLRDFIGALPGSQRILVDIPSAATDVDTRHDLGRARTRRRNCAINPWPSAPVGSRRRSR
jgi:molybdenum cofactor cytidylyltransferase